MITYRFRLFSASDKEKEESYTFTDNISFPSGQLSNYKMYTECRVTTCLNSNVQIQNVKQYDIEITRVKHN